MRTKGWFTFLSVAIAVAAVDRVDSQPPSVDDVSVVHEIVEVRTARLGEAASFWRRGELADYMEIVILRLEIGDLGPFLPQGAPPALFLYGDAVCEIIKDPVADSSAVLVGPRLAEGVPAILWMTPPGLSPQELTPETTDYFIRLVTQPGRAIEVPEPDFEGSEELESLEVLRREYAPSPEEPQ